MFDSMEVSGKKKQRKTEPQLVLGEKLKVANDMSKMDETTLYDGLPLFLQASHKKDKDLRRPDHPDYDPTTLHIPSIDMKNATPSMK
jgi:DNA mismatch repair protein MSH6